MSIDLDARDIETLLTSLNYSKQRVRDSRDSTYEIRSETLARIDAVESKLKNIGKVCNKPHSSQE